MDGYKRSQFARVTESRGTPSSLAETSQSSKVTFKLQGRKSKRNLRDGRDRLAAPINL